MQGRWGEMPFMAFSLCLILGIAASRFFHQYSFACLALAAFALIAAAISALTSERCRLALFLILPAISICGCMLALAQRDGYSKTDMRHFIRTGSVSYDDPSQFEGCVTRDSNVQGDQIASTVDLHAIRNKFGKWTPCRGKTIIRWPANSAEDGGNPEDLLRQGDRVRGSAAFRPPRNYQNPNSLDRIALLERRGIFLLGRVKSARLLEVIPGDCSNPWVEAAVAVRQRIQRNLSSLIRENKQKEAAILASVVVGDYSDLDDITRESFQNSGTYHALVVSGLHVALLAWALLSGFRLLRIPMEYGRLLSASGILFYTCIVGFQASISRCLWMFVLYLTGQMLFRKAKPTNLLLACASSLLIVCPNWLFDVGFQLSFLSIMAISLMAVPLIECHCRPLLSPLSNCGDQTQLFLDPGSWHKLGRRLRLRCELWAETWADRGELLRHAIDTRSATGTFEAGGIREMRCGPLAVNFAHPVLLFGNSVKRIAGRTTSWASRGLPILARLLGKAGFEIGSMAIVSLCVQLWLEMLLAYHYNRLSWVAPLANLFVVPLSSLTLAAGLFSALTAGIPLMSQLALEMAGRFAFLLLYAAQRMSSLPGAWQRCPTPNLAWVIAGILILAGWRFFGLKRLWIPISFVILSLACLSIGFNPGNCLITFVVNRIAPYREKGDAASDLLKLTFLDVGEGDAIVIEFPNRRIWVLDSGGIRNSTVLEGGISPFDVGEAVVSRYLWRKWVTRLDRLLLSHPDQDHAGGMTALLRNFHVSQFSYSGGEGDAFLQEILATAENAGVTIRRLSRSDRLDEGEVEVEILNPGTDTVVRSRNEDSMVLLLKYRRFSVLLTGDLEKSGEAELLSRMEDIHGSLLKVAHHGSRFATSDPFLERVAPGWGIVSAGRNNPFGHPSPLVLLRLLRRGVRPFLTLDQGAISITTNGRHYRISSHVGGMLESGTLP
jgi:competence protein ComEC